LHAFHNRDLALLVKALHVGEDFSPAAFVQSGFAFAEYWGDAVKSPIIGDAGRIVRMNMRERCIQGQTFTTLNGGEKSERASSYAGMGPALR
jgi:hypothetical protein